MAKKTNSGRINFSPKTKEIIGKRAGYICAHPECDRITLGPGDGENETSLIGEAAHIYAAAKNGPRGQDNLTKDQLKSASNGIWLCKNHARLVDVNSGNGFTAPQLISWKMLHEDFIKKNQGRIRRTIGWVHKLEIKESPVLKPGTLELGKVTLIESTQNAAGKTAICEWLAVIGSGQSPSRWIPSRGSKKHYKISAFSPESHDVTVTIENSDYSITVDDKDVAFCGLNFRAYSFDHDAHRNILNSDLTSSEKLCQISDIDHHTLMKLFKHLEKTEFSDIEKVKLESDGELSFLHRNSSAEVSFGGLSGGETNSVLLDLQIAKMSFLSEHTPLIFFFEASHSSLDSKFLSHYLKYLNSSEISFQTVVTAISRTRLPPDIGMTHYVLSGAEKNVTIKRT